MSIRRVATFVSLALVSIAHAGGVVGNGTSGSCTQAAFLTALSGGGAVTFACGAAPHAIILTSTQVIATDTSIDGGDLITLSGGNAVRLFSVDDGATLTLAHLVISNGFASADGGAVSSLATLVIDHTTFQDNQTDSSHSGGAILSLGTLTITASTFTGNVGGNGGSLYLRFADSTTTIADSTFTDNAAMSATDGWGGAILLWSSAVMTVDRTTFSGNSAHDGGAIYLYPGSTGTIRDSHVTDNTVDGSTTVTHHGGGIANNGTLSLARTAVDSNTVVEPPGFGSMLRSGGGIDNFPAGTLTVTGGSVSGNRARRGGGITNFGSLSLTDVTVDGNRAGQGGGLLNTGSSAGSVIAGSTFSNDLVSFAEYPAVTTPLGGAIFNGGGTITLTNSTITGSSGATALQGDNHTLTLTQVTIAGNADGGVGDDQSPNTTSLTFTNVILADNGTHNCGPILFGAFASDFSISSDGTCSTWTGAGNQLNTDAKLAPLADNGGPTRTLLPDLDSPAIDGGTVVGCPGFDQRGTVRPQGPSCDVGAVEVTVADHSSSTTTSTTLPGGCLRAVSFESVQCRLQALVDATAAASKFKPRRKLLALLRGADAKVGKAAAAAQAPKRKRLLRMASASLRKVGRVDQKPAVPTELRAALDETLAGIVADLTSLQTS